MKKMFSIALAVMMLFGMAPIVSADTTVNDQLRAGYAARQIELEKVSIALDQEYANQKQRLRDKALLLEGAIQELNRQDKAALDADGEALKSLHRDAIVKERLQEAPAEAEGENIEAKIFGMETSQGIQE